MEKFKYGRLIWLIVIVIIIIIIESTQKPCSYYLEQELQTEYYGKVIDKYIDMEEHGYKTVVLKRRDVTFTELYNSDVSGLFEYLMVNDSIVKKQGSNDIYIYRNSSLDTVFTLDYGCKE
jgi:hypothetical protein